MNTGAHDVIDYLILFALFLLLLVLSLPTILQLSAIMKEDGPASAREPRPKSARPRFTTVPPSSRLTPIRVQTGPADRALV
jgi:hypothetical protein